VSNVETIERQVEALSAAELAAFRKWFREFDAAAWDRQIEEDIQAGKLDRLADAALPAFKAGECTEFRAGGANGDAPGAERAAPRSRRTRAAARRARRKQVEKRSEPSVFVCTRCAGSVSASPSEIVRHFRDAHGVALGTDEIAEVLLAATNSNQRRSYRRAFLAEQRERLAAWERARLDGSPLVHTRDQEDAAWRQWISAGAPGLGRVARRLRGQQR